LPEERFRKEAYVVGLAKTLLK